MGALIRRVKPEKTGVRAPLGDLEKAVMRCLWDGGPDGCLAAEVQHALEAAGERKPAITTVLTTLDRLAAKGIASKRADGRAHRFAAAVSEADLERRIVQGVLDELVAQFPEAVATYFAQQSGGSALGDLAEQVRALREEGRE